MNGVAVIPAYNEEKKVGDVVQGVLETELVDQVIVVDDCSDDNTETQAEAAGALVIRNDRTRNYGGAIKRGYSKALEHDPDVVYRLDGDGQHNPQDLSKFRAALDDPKYQYVLGNRFKDRTYRESMPFDRLVGNRVVAFLTSLRARTLVTDPPCGFRAMDASYLRQVPYEEFSNDFRIGVEEILAFQYLDAGFAQVAVDCIYRDEESTLSYRDGLSFLYPNFMWWNLTKEFSEHATRASVTEQR